MGNRLTLPLLLLAALLAGGAFFWMSGNERSAGPRRGETSTPAAPAERATATLEAPAAASAAAPGEPARAPAASQPEAAERAAAKGQAAPVVAVRGRIVDRFGAPVPEARVLAAADTGFPLDLELEEELPWLKRTSTTSDAEGRFTLTQVEPGSLRLGVHASGFAPHEQRGVAVPAGGIDLGDVALTRGAILTGQVVDPDGRGVAGARIVREELDGGGLFLMGARRPSAVSGPDGRFRVDELACGAWRFLVQSDDHPDLLVEGLAEEPGVEKGGLRWQLAPGATLAGTVTGVPAAERGQLEVRATRGGGGDGFLALGRGRTAPVDASGAFLLRGLTVGESYTLEARRQRAEREFGFWQRSRSNAVQARAGDSGVILVYQPEAAVTLTVHDARTRQPIERLEVEAGIEWPAPLTDDDGNLRRLFPGGSVRVGGLRPSTDSARVQVNVKATGYREFERADIAVRPGQELDLGPIYLEPVPLLRVRVTDAKSGRPLEGALVRVQKEEEGGAFQVKRSIAISSDSGHEAIEFGEARSARTDAEGWAELSSFEGETVTITARADEHAPGRLEGLALPRGESLEQELRLGPGGAVRVQALDAQGLPLAGAAVEHRADGGGPEGGVFVIGGPRGEQEVTDAEGFALFANLAPGRHSFKLAEKGGGGAAFATMDHVVVAGMGGDDDGDWSPVQVVEGETSELVLRAAPSATLLGRVREAGKILPGATLKLEKPRGESSGPGFRLPGMSEGPEGRSDGEGRYRIADVKAGSYELVVEHPTRRMPARYPLELREGDNTFDVDLSLAILSGRILDQEGKGIAGVRVWPERQEPAGQQVRFRMIMMDDGGNGGVMDSGQFGERALTDAEGRYTLRGVASDADLVVRAEADAVQPGRSEVVRLAPNEVKENVDVHLEPAGSIRVEASLADGAPARFQLVQAEYLDEAEPRPEPKFAFLQQGSTELGGLKPGRWKVNVKSAQGGPGQGDPGQDQEIVVRPGETATASFEVE